MTVEDCLELLIGIQESPKDSFKVETVDYKLLTSIGKQVFTGIPLTDRQHELIKTKLKFYEDQFIAAGYNLNDCLDNLRMPLRELDRTRYIKIVEQNDEEVIAVRFIFNKKLISRMEKIKHSMPHLYDDNDKIHYFPFNERNAFIIIEQFKDSNFEIDTSLLDYYTKVKEIDNNQNKYVPGIYSFKLENLSKNAVDYMISSIGEPSEDNLAIYNDRKEIFGLHYFEQHELEKSLNALTILSKKIVIREAFHILIDPKQYTFNQVLESLLELNRFPLIVLLPEENPLTGLLAIYNGLNGIFFKEDFSVLFRLDNDDNGKEFNQYIKDHNLNNALTENTKVVFIGINKLPKPLLKNKWSPSSALLVESHRLNNKVSAFIDTLDLIIHYDTEPSPFFKSKRNLSGPPRLTPGGRIQKI